MWLTYLILFKTIKRDCSTCLNFWTTVAEQPKMWNTFMTKVKLCRCDWLALQRAPATVRIAGSSTGLAARVLFAFGQVQLHYLQHECITPCIAARTEENNIYASVACWSVTVIAYRGGGCFQSTAEMFWCYGRINKADLSRYLVFLRWL